MQLGLIGAGNMARAVARGLGDPVLVSDSGSGRAQALVDELGGSTGTNREVAQRADLVLLCHKPRQLDAVAAEIAGRARAVASVLGGISVAALQAAYPDTPVFRIEPNTPVEVGAGVMLYAAAPDVEPELETAVLDRFARLGRVVRVAESAMGPASAISGVGPAYLALVAEAWADAAIRHGLPPALAGELVAETMAGTAALIADRGGDTLAVRRAVTSPGGSTARGLAALESAGLRAALAEAMDAVDS